jgi:hypothetical protein
MKTTRKLEGENTKKGVSMDYLDWPGDEHLHARIEEWENGEGFDVYLGEGKIELSYNEICVLEILFANTRLIK